MHFSLRFNFLHFLALVLLLFSFSVKAQEPKLIVPTGHVLSITDVDFNKNGKYMVTVAENEIKYWETATGKLISNFKGNSYEGFANDGKTLITTAIQNDSTGIIKFWDLTTGKLTDSLLGITVRFSKDKNYLMLSSGTDSITVFQAKTKKKLYSLPGSLGVFLNNDKHIFTAKLLADDTGYDIMIWDAVSRKKLNQYHANLAGIQKNLIALEQDSTLKILDLNKGEFVQTFNLPKTKNGGYLSYKMRIGPDLKLALFFTNDKYIAVIDNETYALKKTINLVTSARDIVFNEDGSLFMVLDQDSSATAYDSKTLEKKFQLNGHHDWINKLVFSEDNKFILTSSYDKTAILWNAADGSFIRTFSGKNRTIENSILSANGKYIAQHTNGWTFIFDKANAKKIASLNYNSDKIRFSSDSKYLIINQNYISGLSNTVNDKFTAIFEAATGKLVLQIPYDLKVDEIIISQDASRLALINPEKTQVRVIDLNKEEIFAQQASSNSLIERVEFSANNQTAVLFQASITDKDQKTLRIFNISQKKELWKYDGKFINSDFLITPSNTYLIVRPGGDSVRCFELTSGKYFDMHYEANGIKWLNKKIEGSSDGNYFYVSDREQFVVYSIRDRRKSLELTNLNGYSMASFTPNGHFIYGDLDNKLYEYDLTTGKLIKTTTLRGDAQAMANDELLTSDRTYLHLYKNSKLTYSLLTLESTDQIVIDPFGRYDGTEAARKLLYFTCGTEIISLDQVKDLLWVPNLAERITKGETVNAAKLSDLTICGLTPEVETIESKTDDYQFKITPRKGGLGETALYINDIEVKRFLPAQLTKVGTYYLLKIPKLSLATFLSSQKENQITVKAYTLKNDISSRGAKITNLKPSSNATPPNLYAVIVGVSDYKGTELDLKYAAKDAADISNALGFSARKLLNADGKEHVFIYNLNTSKDAQFPEKLSIKNAILDVGKKATANDIFLVFFAGHGVMEGAKKQFYFLTADASKESLVAQVGISTTELSEWMKPANIKAQKRILIFDACNSGQAVNELVKIGGAGQQYLAARNDDNAQQIKAIEKLNEKSGLFILSASASNQSAYEMGKYSQGLLTYALLKAMKDQPDILDDNKFLNVGRWFSAAEKTVTDLVRESGNRQEPQVVSTSNFNIGIVDQDVMSKIILPQENILFTNSNFQNSDEAISADDLELNKAVSLAFNKVSARGTTSNISYVVGSNSPNAYTLTGRYDVKNEMVTVKVNVWQSKTIKHRLELVGKKDNITVLAEEIVKQVADWASKLSN